jgi:heme exporter protein A
MNPQPAPALSSETPVLSVSQLAAQRGERLLFRGLDLRLMSGDICWLQGRNGRGKTTLLRLLSGLSTPAEGQFHVSTAPTSNHEPPRSRLMYLGHANALKDDLSVLESLRFLAAIGGQSVSDEELQAALKRLGMASRARALVRTLSQGQRRRVSLSRLVLPETPALWLLDEPLDALDRSGISTLLEILESHAERGGAVLMTSHQAVELPRRPVRVINLDDWAEGSKRSIQAVESVGTGAAS